MTRKPQNCFPSTVRLPATVAALFVLAVSLSFFASCSAGKPGVTRDQALVPPKAVTFEVRLAKDSPEEGFHQFIVQKTGKALFVSDAVAIDKTDIASAKAITDNGKPAVEFKLTEQGAEKMRAFTRGHINEKVAIFLNGKLAAAPTIKGEISQMGVIHGNFTMEQARLIAEGLSSN